jgi:hypothetical protein
MITLENLTWEFKCRTIFLLPENIIDGMVREIPDARRMDREEANHYSILFQPNTYRDQAMLDFLKT